MLDVRELHVAYGARDVLRGVDLRVETGEVVGLVGPNGCGKTTLLKAVAGLVPVQRGNILIAARPIHALSRRQIAQTIAVVPQAAVLPVGFTAIEAVVMGRTPHLRFLEQESAADYRRAHEALVRVDSADLADRPVDELSGGERQNVILARVLAQDTPVLLLDEPTANLDIGHQMSVFRLARELARDHGIAVLAAVHDLTLASLYCDRLALMSAGVIVAEGQPSDVLTATNIRSVYKTEVMTLRPEGLRGPIVIPASPAGRVEGTAEE